MTFPMNTVLKYQLTVCCSKTCLARDINIKIQINKHTNKTQRLDFLGKERQGKSCLPRVVGTMQPTFI